MAARSEQVVERVPRRLRRDGGELAEPERVPLEALTDLVERGVGALKPGVTQDAPPAGRVETAQPNLGGPFAAAEVRILAAGDHQRGPVRGDGEPREEPPVVAIEQGRRAPRRRLGIEPRLEVIEDD